MYLIQAVIPLDDGLAAGLIIAAAANAETNPAPEMPIRMKSLPDRSGSSTPVNVSM